MAGSLSSGPVVLVLHVGGNDIASLRTLELLAVMRADMDRFPLFFSRVLLVWSEITPRLVWRGARNFLAADRARRAVNARISRFVRARAGVAIRHSLLENVEDGVLSDDGVHLTDIGCDIFLSGLQDGVERALVLLGGGRPPFE